MKLKMKFIKLNYKSWYFVRYFIFWLLIFSFVLNYERVLCNEINTINKDFISNNNGTGFNSTNIRDGVSNNAGKYNVNDSKIKNNTNDKEDNFIEDDEIYDYDEYDEYDENMNIKTIKDPFEKFNRKIFTFNIFILENFAEPIIKSYKFVTPKFVRDRLNNFGDRFYDPITLINSILQFDLENSVKTIATFATNMTIGIFGLFNPAKKFGFYRDKKTFNETFGFYGIGNGFYLMLPFLGPNTLRSSVGLLTGFYVDPFYLNRLDIGNDNGSLVPNYLVIPRYAGQYAGQIDSNIVLNKKFLQKSFDPYIFLRESFVQNNNYKTKKGKGNEKN